MKILFFISTLALSLSSGCYGSPTSAADYSPLDRLMTGFLAVYQIPGGALAVAKNGKVLYSKGFGYADLEKKGSCHRQLAFPDR